MQSIIQIFKVNDARRGEKDGRKWEMQDAECGLIGDSGVIESVGVLPIPKDLIDKAKPGVYIGSFALKPDYKTRRILPVLTGLQEYTVKAAPAPAPAKG